MGADQLPLATHDASQDYVTIDNQTITGFAKGLDSIKLEFDSDAFSDDADRDGNPFRMKSNDERATLTLRLTQFSPSNSILAAMAAADRRNGFDVRAVSVVDGTGKTTASGAEAWVKKLQPIMLGNEVSERVWEIRIGRCSLTVGGTK